MENELLSDDVDIEDDNVFYDFCLMLNNLDVEYYLYLIYKKIIFIY